MRLAASMSRRASYAIWADCSATWRATRSSATSIVKSRPSSHEQREMRVDRKAGLPLATDSSEQSAQNRDGERAPGARKPGGPKHRDTHEEKEAAFVDEGRCRA